MIEGVKIHKLKQIPDERGKIMHMLRSDDEHFEKFGEIYFSIVNPGVVKAWHIHREMTLNYACVSGMVKLVLYDDRPQSGTLWDMQEIFIGEDNYVLVTIPPGIWNGFKGISVAPSMVANCATLPYEEIEISRMSPRADGTIPYNWEVRHG